MRIVAIVSGSVGLVFVVALKAAFVFDVIGLVLAFLGFSLARARGGNGVCSVVGVALADQPSEVTQAVSGRSGEGSCPAAERMIRAQIIVGDMSLAGCAEPFFGDTLLVPGKQGAQ